MSTPLFSVVIPTRNRSFLVGHAIRSVLDQSFPDYELIVADNDDTEATSRVLSAIRNPRLRHARTGGLSMQDNWEHASEAARGDYLLVLEDKQMLKRHTLERLATEIDRLKPESLRWRSDRFNDESFPPRIRRGGGDGSARMVDSDTLLHGFLNDARLGYKLALPLPQLSCISRRLLHRIKAGPMQRLFHTVAPDVVLALLQLNYTEAICDIQSPLVLYLSSVHSNGKSVSNKGEAGRQFIRQLPGGGGDCYDRVPVKCITIPGTICNDFLRTQEKVQGRLARHSVNWTRYFVDCYLALLGPAERGIDMSEEMKEWQRAFSEQPAVVQAEVRRELPQLTKGNLAISTTTASRLLSKFGPRRLERLVKWLYRGYIRRDPEWRFSNPLDYYEWEASNVAKGTILKKPAAEVGTLA